MRSASSSISRNNHWVIYIISWIVIGVIICVSIQPSLYIARLIVKWADFNMITWALGWIPLIGNIVKSFIVPGMLYIIAIADFTLTQYFELDWFFGEVTDQSKRYRWLAYTKEVIQVGIISPIYVGGWSAFANDSPVFDTERIIWTNIAAFGLMVFACEFIVKLLQPYLKRPTSVG
jgi:hypothetical protein